MHEISHKRYALAQGVGLMSIGRTVVMYALGAAQLTLAGHTALAATRAPERHAATPHPHSVRAVHTYGWTPLAADVMLLWLGVEEPYRVRLAPGCPDLRQIAPTALTRHGRSVVVGADAVLFGRLRCAVRAIDRAEPAPGMPRPHRALPLVAAPATNTSARQ
ncbi:hypothetical protein G3580_09355 [Nitrogeniibacter mangrovi]|uniref:Uncharacterized protein n=1 Tax=Nitrogeniibacter mangrovi TaxID=2016596 RepID=A0A6C1B6B5_9RHOO|nr:DUF6491 family protein [Nitrogeniibacter mangrovi]QID17830.1 hypothetical protein G3580_09355 [Nitrogeniibacter mangrovi]